MPFLKSNVVKSVLISVPFVLMSACGGGSSSSSPATPPGGNGGGNQGGNGGTPTAGSKLVLHYQDNIAETLYYNSTAPGTPQFTYQPSFVFKNNSDKAITVQEVAVNDSAYLINVSYVCDTQTKALPCTLEKGKTLTVKGTLADFSESNNTKSLSLTLKDTAQATLLEHQITTLFVPYVDNHIAVRSINLNNSENTLYLAAAYGGNTLSFAKNSNNQYIGTLGSSAQFKTDDFPFPDKKGGVVYLPHGQSGTLYLSFSPFTSEPTPNPNASNTPGFFTAELTYLNQVPGAPAKCSGADGSCEQLTLDTTYVNFIQYFGSASTLGTSSYLPDSVLTGYGYAGATGAAIDKGTKAVYTDIYNQYQTFDAPWKYDSSKTDMTDNYFASSSGGSIPDEATILYAPIQLYKAGVPTNVPMANDYYDDYVTALWKHLETHPIYVDANAITQTAKQNCILKGQVNSATQKLEFSGIVGNDCPTEAYVVQAMAPTFNSCAGSAAPVKTYAPGVTTNCADTPNLTFNKFNTCDFITAAGSASCGTTEITQANFVNNDTLWGPNGTFRAIVGRAITSYQAAGILPICQNSGMTVISQASPMNQENSRAAVATGKAFENPSCLTGLDAKKPVYNLYTKEVGKYVQAYTYSYGDFLGMDATMTYSRNAFAGSDCASNPNSAFCQLPKALPITLKLH